MSPLFPIVDARKTMRWINEEAGTKVQGHGLRATFASIAEERVSSALLKRMMNHAAGGRGAKGLTRDVPVGRPWPFRFRSPWLNASAR